MKILSIEFTPNWSWGLVFSNFFKDNYIERIFMCDSPEININNADVVLSQNVTLLKKFSERLKTICRIGGNYNFDSSQKKGLENILVEMSKCYCLIATNQKLFDIASSIHNMVYLIPNGLDLDEWKPIAKNRDNFVVGFCGNISIEQYRKYKGYDIVKDACDGLGIELKTALFKEKQIEHTMMNELFYSEIDCIVHPTLGEGCSNTLMEACACGVPIITTKEAGYHGELMKRGKNVLFCERSVSSIQQQILSLYSDSDLKYSLSLASREFAIEHHNVYEIAQKYEKIFNNCHQFNKGN